VDKKHKRVFSKGLDTIGRIFGNGGLCITLTVVLSEILKTIFPAADIFYFISLGGVLFLVGVLFLNIEKSLLWLDAYIKKHWRYFCG
jgi:hypothetical protein